MNLSGYTALFGGSFNPPHMGHQMVCLYLLEALQADTVWLLPAWRHPFGKRLASFEHRVTMCQHLAVPFGSRVSVSRVEARDGASGRTYDTLRYLLQDNPDHRFAMVIGSDILRETSQWYRWDEITQLVRVVVLARTGYTEEEASTPIAIPEVASVDIRKRLRAGQSIGGLTPASIASYLTDNALYRDDEQDEDAPQGSSC